MSRAYGNACDFAAYNLPVFPVDGKVPLVGKGGLHNASTDPAQLLRWHNRFPNAGWAVACGEQLAVVDVDVKHGADPQAVLALLSGPTVMTGQANGHGRGLHIYCAGPAPTADTPLQGVEVRGNGSYVVLPGSPHESGVTYEWAGDRRPWHPGELVPLPAALRPLRRERTAPVEDERIPVGQRDTKLISLAGTMRRAGMTEREIAAALLQANADRCDPPLSRKQVLEKARSIVRYDPADSKPRRLSFADRRTDLVARLAEPPVPTPWRVTDLAADGKLTALTGTGDVGKSWLMIGCCLRVHDGGLVAGMACAQGRALYVDAEMGEAEFVDRLRGLDATGHEFDHLDAVGLDFGQSADVDRLEQHILDGGYQLVVLDSLRALAPSMKENESDSVAPILMTLRGVARRTGAAIVVVHHRGESDKFYRGSTTIRDQTDAMLTLWDDEQGLRLRCKPGGRMRFAASPADRWLALDPFGLGVKQVEPDPPPPSTREILKQQILRQLPSETKSAVAAAIGTNRAASSFLRAWESLQTEGKIDEIAGVWTAVAAAEPLGGATPQQHPQTTFGEER